MRRYLKKGRYAARIGQGAPGEQSILFPKFCLVPMSADFISLSLSLFSLHHCSLLGSSYWVHVCWSSWTGWKRGSVRWSNRCPSQVDTSWSFSSHSEHKKSRVTPRHIQLAVRNDEELNRFLGGITISGGASFHFFLSFSFSNLFSSSFEHGTDNTPTSLSFDRWSNALRSRWAPSWIQS